MTNKQYIYTITKTNDWIRLLYSWNLRICYLPVLFYCCREWEVYCPITLPNSFEHHAYLDTIHNTYTYIGMSLVTYQSIINYIIYIHKEWRRTREMSGVLVWQLFCHQYVKKSHYSGVATGAAVVRL